MSGKRAAEKQGASPGDTAQVAAASPAQPKAQRTEWLLITGDTADAKVEEMRIQLISHLQRIQLEIDQTKSDVHLTRVNRDMVSVKERIDAIEKGAGAKPPTQFADMGVVDAKFDALKTELEALGVHVRGNDVRDKVQELDEKVEQLTRTFQDSLAKINDFGVESLRWSDEYATRSISP